MTKVFLGGTRNNSTWRDDLIKMLEIDYFNPVVVDWTPECMKEEIKQREECDYCLYVITPKMIDVYSIAEVVDDSNKRPEKTILCILTKDGNLEFDIFQTKSLVQLQGMVCNNGARVFNSLESVAKLLNGINI